MKDSREQWRALQCYWCCELDPKKKGGYFNVSNVMHGQLDHRPIGKVMQSIANKD
jgi:hypothetical protein